MDGSGWLQEAISVVSKKFRIHNSFLYLFAVGIDLCHIQSVEVGVRNISCAIIVVQQELERRELIVVERTMVAVYRNDQRFTEG